MVSGDRILKCEAIENQDVRESWGIVEEKRKIVSKKVTCRKIIFFFGVLIITFVNTLGERIAKKNARC